MTRQRRLAAWATVAGLALLAAGLHTPQPAASTPLLLLGPVAPLAAQIQWLRFHATRLRGQEARALELAASALTLDPHASEGWQRLAAHLLFDLASREREPELERRRSFFLAGVTVLARGAERAADPAELELLLALALVSKAEADPELHRDGARGLYEQASAALVRAQALGDGRAAELLPQVRALAAGAE